MDHYVRTASLNSKQQLDTIAKQTARILQWLPMHFCGDFEPTFLETLIKSLVLLFENASAQGFELLSEMNSFPPPHNMLARFYDHHMDIFQHLHNALTMFNGQILRNSSNGGEGGIHLISNAVILDTILQQVKHIYGDQFMISYSVSPDIKHGYMDKLYIIINRLFRLPPSEIDIGIVRIITNVEFSVLGKVFCYPNLIHNNQFPKCIIFVERLRKLTANMDIRDLNKFLRLMVLSIEKNGEKLFQQCIENTEFLDILQIIFCRFFGIAFGDLESNLSDNNGQLNNNCARKSFSTDILYIYYLLTQFKPITSLKHFTEFPLSKLLTQLSVVYQ